MAESLQESKHEVQQSGDIDTATPSALEDVCKPEKGGPEEHKPEASDQQELLIDIKEECNDSESTTKAETVPIISSEVECLQPPAINPPSQPEEEEEKGDENHAPPPIPSVTPVVESTAMTASLANIPVPVKMRELADKKKDDDKLGIYKALAIKLKKELVKTRDELSKLKDEYHKEVSQLKERVDTLEKTLDTERVSSGNTNAALEANIKNLRNQLEEAERDMQSLQIDFEDYKTRATKILQQNQPVQSSSTKSFEEDRYKQLKSLSEEQKGQIKDLRVQVSKLTERISESDAEINSLNAKLMDATERLENMDRLQEDYAKLKAENEVLKPALEQYKAKVVKSHNKAEKRSKSSKHQAISSIGEPTPITQGVVELSKSDTNARSDTTLTGQEAPVSPNELYEGTIPQEDSPSGSVKDDAHTNSSSSFDSSAYGYVHIKPAPFEIISRSSVLEDAQNQIDNLTKAYLDSESTNSLLTEQVRALKEEIRRIQRGNDRMELANNLEYLKNVVFKFLSLDHSQVEQKQRLIPVISTILKLSPEETSKLESLSQTERGGMTSSFFKL